MGHGQRYVLGVDQGTGSTKAVVMDNEARIIGMSAAFSVRPHLPRAGWVEYDPWDILTSVVSAIRSALEVAGIRPADVAACGLANQGETVIAFDRENGDPVYPAISWQDRRNSEAIAEWTGSVGEDKIRRSTGLIPDTYFSASKIDWLLKSVPRARDLAAKGRLCAATSDTWLVRGLLGDRTCVSDASTASRTMLFDLRSLDWESDLLAEFCVPRSVLPDVIPNDHEIGILDQGIVGPGIRLAGLCVDQQAALFGQGCLNPGDTKITYGTGCFMLSNIGPQWGARAPGLLTSVGWRLGDRTDYVIDGGVYSAGSVITWLIDKVGLAQSVDEIEDCVNRVDDSGGVFFIPALSGLAAPYWLAGAQGGWHGLRLSTTRSDLIRSAVESIAFRVKDVVDAAREGGVEVRDIRVDGGLSQSEFLMQFQADLLGTRLLAFDEREATAFGAGLLAGIAVGKWSVSDVACLVRRTPAREYVPDLSDSRPLELHEEWKCVLRKLCEGGEWQS